MLYPERTWFAGLTILSLCMGAWADSEWEKIDIPRLPQVQIANYGGKAIAVSGLKIGYRYVDSLKAWISQGKLPGQSSQLIRGSHSAYIYDYGTGEITPFPALPAQSPWPPIPSQYPRRLGEDSLRYYCELYTGLLYSEKAQPGWKSATGTPWGGAFGSIVLLPDVVLGGTDSGMLVSEDRGRSWKYSQGLPREPIRVFRAGSGEAFAIPRSGGVVYRSNQGVQWEPMFLPDSSTASDQGWIESLLALGDTVWVTVIGGRSGVWRSLDAGKNWTLHHTGLGWNWTVSDDPEIPAERAYHAQSIIHDGQALWVLSIHDYDSRPFRSTDGGRNWTRTDAGLTDQYYQKLFTLWGKLYAVYAEESIVSVWSFDPVLNQWFKDNGIPQKQPGFGWGVNVAVDGDTAWLASGSDLYRSVRGTGIWETRSILWRASLAYPTEYRPIDGMAALSGEVLLLGRLDEGLGNFHASDDGGNSWHVQRPFFPVAAFQGNRLEARGNWLMVIDPGTARKPRLLRAFPDSIRLLDTSANRLVVWAGSKVFSAPELEGSWSEASLPETVLLDSSFALGIMDGQLVGMTMDTKWVSPDVGSSWIRQPIHFPKSAINELSVEGNDIWCLTEDGFSVPWGNNLRMDVSHHVPRGPKMARMKNRVFVSGDNPALVVVDDPGYVQKKRWTKAELGNASVTALYASDGFFAAALGNGAFRISRDSAMTLENRSPAPGPITSLTGRPEDLFASVSGGVFFTADSGTSWTRKPVPDSLVLFKVENELWVGWTGTDSLIFSKDGGETWEKEASPLPAGETTALYVNDGAAYLGTRSYGVFKRSLVPTVSISPGRSSQAYPHGKKPSRRRMQGQGWVFGEEPETARDLRGRRSLP